MYGQKFPAKRPLFYKKPIAMKATVAEWLRRLTRNQIPYGSAGSNPAGCVLSSFADTIDQI